MKRLFTILALVLIIAGPGHAALTGIKTIGVDYPTIAAAIADLNTQGAGPGGIIFNVPANYLETFTTPSDGMITTITGSASNPIIFQKSGAGVNPQVVAATGTGTMDAIIMIAGSDYITFDGIDLRENILNTTPTTQTEWGFAILKATATDGSQNITIKNSNINLEKNYISSVCVYSNNHTSSDVTQLVITNLTGTNSNIKIFGNTFNSYTGVYLNGYNDAVAPYNYLDQNNEIGKDAANNINNVAGGTAAGYGIYGSGQNNIKVANNVITSNMAGTGQPTGIMLTNARNGSYNLYGNNVRLQYTGPGTTNLYGIYCDMGVGSTSNSMNVYNNIVTNCSFVNAGSGNVYYMYLGNLGTNVNIYGNNVTGNTIGSASATATGRAYYLYAIRPSPTTGPLNLYNNTVTNNTKTQSMPGGGLTQGICANGLASVFNCYNNTFSNNVLSSNGGSYGFNISVSGTRNVYDNLVSDITKAEGTFYGLYVYTGTSNSGDGYFYRNKIQNIEGLTAGSNLYGIYSSSSSNASYFYNNFISDLRALNSTSVNGVVGFYGSAGLPNGFYNNSIYLAGTSTGTNFGSSAVFSSTSSGLDLRNNILVNTVVPKGTGKSAVLRTSGTALTNYAATSNYNDFYIPAGASNCYYFDGTNSDLTLAAMKTRLLPRETQSVSELPSFISTTQGATDLHLQASVATACEAGGFPVTLPFGITTDFDGNPRYPNSGYPVNAGFTPFAPDMGADEIGGLTNDLIPPSLTFNPFGNTNLTTARILNVVINDGSGVPTIGTGLPRLFWKVNSGSYQVVTAICNSPENYTFVFGGGVNIGDVISYYIIAQDNSPAQNLVSYPGGATGMTPNPPTCGTPTTTPYQYTIMETISGVKHVGIGKDFATLSEASASINLKWIGAPLTLILDDATYPSESFPVVFRSNEGSSSVNVLTIKPNSGVSPIIQGNSGSGIINLMGADYMIIDGSNNGTSSRNLTIKNHSTNSGSYGIGLLSLNGDPATNVTIKNSIMSCKPVHSSVIDITVIKTDGISGGINNVFLDNNIIRGGFVGVKNYGVLGKTNSGWQITNNIIGCEADTLYITDIGISLTYSDNTLIYNNDIMGPATGSLNVGQTGINLNTGATNTSIKNNKIHDFIRISDDGWGVSGIWYSAESTSVTEIINNTIYNVKSPGMNPGVGQNITYGIFVRRGGNIRILNNSINLTGQISSFYDASSSCLGFYYQATSNIEIKNNILRNAMTTTDGPANQNGRPYLIMWQTDQNMFSGLDYNDYYADGTNGTVAQNFTNGTGILTNYQTLADWRTYTGQDSHSIAVNPQFTSATNLIPTTIAMPHAGIYLPNVPVDIMNVSRVNPPDMGAYEFTPNPTIVTTSSSSVMNNTATLNGTANASNYTFNLFFDYGTSASYGSSVAATPVTITGTSLSSMNAGITGLAPLTLYHFRARGVTSNGVTVYGADMTFTTIADPPTVVTAGATSVTGTTATLNGTVNANFAASSASFEYGVTTSYGTIVAATPSSITGSVVTPVSTSLTALLPNTTYHYRALATNSTGTTYGLDMTFTTPAIAPLVVTNPATLVGATNGQVNGSVTANNSLTTVTFEYGLTTAYGTTVNAIPATVGGMSTTSVMANLTSLTINTTYHYRVVGVNSAGTIYGADQLFTTNCIAPVVTVSGPATACATTGGHVYTTQAGNINYVWSVSAGGTISSGAGTNSITVVWNTAGPQTVNANYSTPFGCSAGVPTVYNVTVNPAPSPVITGSTTGCQYSTGNTYSTTAGMSNYTWTVSAGGTITSGTGTNSIQVTWNTPGARTVSVNYSNASGCQAATATVMNVNVNAAPVPTITGSNSLCANSGFYTYTTEAGMTNYNWSVSGGGMINFGIGTNQIQVSWNGSGAQSVSVNFNNAGGCPAPSATVYNVTVNPLPGVAGSVTGTSAVCAGTTGVAYSIAPVTGAITYVWMLPAGASIASGSGTNSITVDFSTSAVSGNISVYANNLCGNGTSSPIFPVTVNAVPAAAGIINGLTEVCEGTTGVTYIVGQIANATTYNWIVPAGVDVISGSGTMSITVNFTPAAVSGIFTVSGSNSCGNGTTSNLAVSVNELPETPVVTLTGSILSSSAAAGNQWYKDGVAITGATGQTHDAALTGTGFYWCDVTLSSCSSDTSNHVYFVVTGLNILDNSGFSIYPVPNEGRFTISLSGNFTKVNVTIFNNLGEKVYESKGVEVSGKLERVIDLRGISAGLYTVIVDSPEGRMIRKMVVNR